MTGSVPSVLVVGSFMMDLVVRVQRRPAVGETVTGDDFGMFPGGKGYNQALSARRLGAAVTMVGRLGRDLFGEEFMTELGREGIVTDCIVRDDASGTGVATPMVDAAGDNSIVIVPRANLRLTSADVDRAVPHFATADVILLQREVAEEANLRAAQLGRQHGKTVVLNPAPAPASPLDPELLRLIDIITPNETETAVMTGIDPVDERAARRAADKLLNLGVKAVVLTLGARGALVVDASGARLQPGYQAEVVDTTGAGDAFNGGLAVGLGLGFSLDEAVALANAAGAQSVTHMGAGPSMPTRSQLHQFWAARGLRSLLT